MNIAEALAQARALAEAEVLTDTVTLTRVTGTTTDSHGTETDTWAQVYAGPGLVQVGSTQPVVTASAGAPVDATAYVAKLPLSVDVRTGDRVEVTASLTVPHAGRRWRVTSVPTQGWGVLHRCPVDPD